MAGAAFGFRTEVYATPTGIFVSAQRQADSTPVTLLERIKETSIRLAELKRLERLIESLSMKQITLSAAIAETDESPSSRQREYPAWALVISIFVLGASSSFLRYGGWRAALCSGMITGMVWMISTPLARAWRMSGIFCDFAASLLALLLAQVCACMFHIPSEMCAIGSLILLVPGLTLTTAISELADHQFLSGTSKVMKGALTLLAMGTAHVLMQECSLVAGLAESTAAHLPAAPLSHSDPKAIAASIITLTTFSVIFEAPREALLGSVISGMVGWWVLQQFNNPSLFVVASFVASFTVGVLSLLLGRIFRVPSQTFSVPGILTLVPGLLALSSFKTIANGQGSAGTQLAVQVALMGGAIAFGLFSARLPLSGLKNQATHPRLLHILK